MNDRYNNIGMLKERLVWLAFMREAFATDDKVATWNGSQIVYRTVGGDQHVSVPNPDLRYH